MPRVQGLRGQGGEIELMETRYILKKDHLEPWLRRLCKKHRVVAPLKNKHGDTLYREIDAVGEVPLDLISQPQASAKSFFMPQQEVLFNYRVGESGYEFVENSPDVPTTVYFGLRSCDLSAILYTDVIFMGQRKDPGYKRRREASVLISIACHQPQSNCFCHATKSGPFLEFGYDLQLTDLGNRFLVEVGRVRGEELINEWQPFFSLAEEEDVKAQYQLVLEATGLFSRNVDVGHAVKVLAEDGVDETIWRELAARCQDCGGCAYLCPTCTCFTIRDQQLTEEHGERLRCWDACTLGGFSRMAGGHNPVAKEEHALKRRFQHKLRDDVRKHGRPSCVGCGRCVGICFGGVDIVRFIDQVSEEDLS